MLTSLFHLLLLLFDIFIKTFVLGTVIYFYGASFVNFIKSALNTHNAPLATEKATTRKRRHDETKGKKNAKEESNASSLHWRHRRTRAHSFSRPSCRSSLHLPSRSFSTNTRRSNKHYPTPSYSTPSPTLHQHSSRVGQLVQQFEIGRRPETQPDIMNSGMDSKINDTASSMKLIDRKPPLFHLSPGKLTTPTSTRAIDYRSIGFRPAFSSWEKRTTEGNQLLVSSPSLTSPVWSTHFPPQSHSST